MSEHRTPDKTILLKIKGKKTVKIELFAAKQFKQNYRPFKKIYSPRPLIRPFDKEDKMFWENHFRIRIKGQWVRNRKIKYLFYTIDQVMEMIKQELEK